MVVALAACSGAPSPSTSGSAGEPVIVVAASDPVAARAFYRDVFDVGPDHVRVQAPDEELAAPTAAGGTTVGLLVYVDDVDDVIERAVARGATSRMRVRRMWWGDRYGQVIDPWGHRWGVARRVESVSAAEQTRRLAQLRAGEPPTLGPVDPRAALPPEYRRVTAVLVVPDAAQAAAYYIDHFGARELFRVHEPTGKVAHVELLVAGGVIMLDREHPSLYPRAPATLGHTTAAAPLGRPARDPTGHVWR